jgi:ketosteroid isomerase-like protein
MSEVADMDDVDEFLAAVLPRQRQADLALLNGDSGPRKMLWSHRDPVTVLGAAKTVSGWSEVESLFDWLASNFSNGDLYELEVTAAGVSCDLGYVLGAEHSRASVGGEAPAPIELRVTLIFRREDGDWKEVHRHADPIPGILSTHEQLDRFR